MTIILSTIGSRGVTVDVGSSALPEATGGVAIEYGLHDGPLIFTPTAQEARELHELLAEQLASDAEPEAVILARVAERPATERHSGPERPGDPAGLVEAESHGLEPANLRRDWPVTSHEATRNTIRPLTATVDRRGRPSLAPR